MPLKIIFIDWDGTLSSSRFWEHWQTEDPESYGKIQRVLFDENPGMIHDWMRGLVSAELITNKLAHRTGLDAKVLLKNLEKSCRSMILTHPEVLGVIQAKRKNGIKVVIATDNMDTFTRWTAPSLELEKYFDGILSSTERGALKEDVAKDGTSLFFHHYLSQNVTKPKQALWIDDRSAQQTAKKIGLQFAQVSPGFNVIEALNAV